MLPIQKMLIAKNYSKGVTIQPRYIVIHETANTSPGANALAHFHYWNENDNANSSVHFVVDDSNIIQLLEINQRAWHVGDNKGHSNITNSNAIGIEICVNSGGDYMKARQNAIDLVKYLFEITRLPHDALVTHHDASGKNCPTIMLAKGLWDDFKNQVFAVKNKIEKVVNGMDITTLQIWLNANGFTDENGNKLKVDGDEGKHTKAAKEKAKELLKYIFG